MKEFQVGSPNIIPLFLDTRKDNNKEIREKWECFNVNKMQKPKSNIEMIMAWEKEIYNAEVREIDD